MFHGISATIEGMALASYMAEIAMELAPAPPEADAQLRLLLNCLYMLSERHPIFISIISGRPSMNCVH